MVSKVKEKNWFVKHWIISIFLGLVAIGFVSGIVQGIIGEDNSKITGEVIDKQEEQIQEEVIICKPNWMCNDWAECSNGTQIRICTDINDCEIEVNKPIEIQACEYGIPQEINLKIEGENSSDDWASDLKDSLEGIQEGIDIYNKKQACAELCAGESINIPAIKTECLLSCSEIYYYGGEEALDEYIGQISEEESSSDDWAEDLKESLEELEKTMDIYKKIDECTELCAGEDIDIDSIKSVCSFECYQIYYYAGEEGLDKYIEELRGENGN